MTAALPLTAAGIYQAQRRLRGVAATTNGYCEVMRPLTFVGNHDVTRIATRLEDVRHLTHALAVLFTTSGIPSVYAGDEQAFRGVKYERANGDEEIRPAFPPEGPAGLAPYGRDVYRLHQDLIGLRRRHPWLGGARTEVLQLANLSLAYRVTGPGGGLGLWCCSTSRTSLSLSRSTSGGPLSCWAAVTQTRSG